MVDVFEIVADATRRKILDALLSQEQLVGHLVDELGLTQPSVSKHLRVLRMAGLVRVRPEAQRRWYSVHAERLLELDAWLMPYRRLWGERLDALERHLDQEEGE